MRMGVFDSGLGGLTAVRALRSRWPGIEIIYLGDTARVPYGIRSNQVIRRYATECASFLADQKVDLIVVACNTVSASALEYLKENFQIPIFGVIEPGAKLAVKVAQGLPIGILGTRATMDSRAYDKVILGLSPGHPVYSNAAPLLVPLVEEGWLEGEVPRLMVTAYLEPLIQQKIGALILGCTHYPLLRGVFEKAIRTLTDLPVEIVDSGRAIGEELESVLPETSKTDNRAQLSVYVTDAPRRFLPIAQGFLGENLSSIEVVELFNKA